LCKWKSFFSRLIRIFSIVLRSGACFRFEVLCSYDRELGVIICLGSATVYTEGTLLEGTFFVISHYMFRHNWPSSVMTG
jgi:hypothetical protein